MKLASIRATGAGGERLRERAPSAAKVERSLRRLLRGNVLCSMATVDRRGRAHVNTAFFAWSEDVELFFLSHPRSHHCRNVAANRSMAIAVFSSEQSWGGSDRGLQLFGTGALATGSRASAAERLYGRRFRDYAGWKRSLPTDDPAREYRFYRFVPRSVKVFDERTLGGAVFVSASVVPRRRR